MIKLRILSYEGEPQLSRCGQCSYKGFYKRETGVSEMCEGGAELTKEDTAPLALRRSHCLQTTPKDWKRQENRLSPNTPRSYATL